MSHFASDHPQVTVGLLDKLLNNNPSYPLSPFINLNRSLFAFFPLLPIFNSISFKKVS